jgi:hypothetical protein
VQPSPPITISCDDLVEFEEDAAAFAQQPPEFVNGAAPAAPGASAPSPANPHPTSNEDTQG